MSISAFWIVQTSVHSTVYLNLISMVSLFPNSFSITSIETWFESIYIAYLGFFLRNLKVLSRDKMALKWWTKQYGPKRCQMERGAYRCHLIR